MTDIYSDKGGNTSDQTKDIGTHSVVLREGGVKLALTIVDTPGYGDALDNTEYSEPVVEYVDKQFDKFLEAETRVKRESLAESRVHACLYFIAPTGHGLKKVDIEFMMKLQKKVKESSDASVPFAVIGSDLVLEDADGRKF
jgi:septin 7